MSTLAGKWIAVVAVSAIALGGAGCARSATSVRDASQFVVLDSGNATESVVATPMPGLDANSVPMRAITGVSGASDIVVASGTPVVTRERAIAITQPKAGQLVSAIYVLLPKKFMTGVLSNPKLARPTTAWIVTWTGVPSTVYGGHRIGPATGQGGTPKRPAFYVGDATAVIDATTGEQLLLAQYPTPNSTAGQGVTGAGVGP